jgi:hypothetical protein
VPGSARLTPGKHKAVVKMQERYGVPDQPLSFDVGKSTAIVKVKFKDGKGRIVVDVAGGASGAYSVKGVEGTFYAPGTIAVPAGTVELVPSAVSSDCTSLPPQTVTVGKDEKKKLKVKPQKATATLQVDWTGDDDQPASGFVIVDGSDVGKTGAPLEVSACAKQLQVLIDGKKVHEQALTLTPGQTTKLALGKAPPPAPPSPFTSPFQAISPPVDVSKLKDIRLENADGPIDYTVTAERFAERGNTVTVTCPSQLRLGKVFGAGPYAVTSSICFAAVHAGLLQRGQEGSVRFTIGPVQAVKGTRENNVTAYDAEAMKTFSFVK